MKSFSTATISDTYEETAQYSTSSGCNREEAKERSLHPRIDGQPLNTGLVGVLIIDDNKLNGAAIRRSFSALRESAPVFEVRTFEEALDALCGVHSRLPVLPPCVLLLNLDMPHSFEFLRQLRQDSNPLVRNLTVVVHSASNSVAVRNRADDWNVAGYVHDRPGRTSLLGLARLLRQHIKAVELPELEPFGSRDVPPRCTPDCKAETPFDTWPFPIFSRRNEAPTQMELGI